MPDSSSEHGTSNCPWSVGEEQTEALWEPPVLPADNGSCKSQSLSLPVLQEESPDFPETVKTVHESDKQTAPKGIINSQVTPPKVTQKVTTVQPTISEKSTLQKQSQPAIVQERRSAREKKPRQVYDASSGKFVAPSTVADD